MLCNKENCDIKVLMAECLNEIDNEHSDSKDHDEDPYEIAQYEDSYEIVQYEDVIVQYEDVDELEFQFVASSCNAPGSCEVVEDSELHYQQCQEMFVTDLNVENSKSFYLKNQLYPKKVNQSCSDKSTCSIHTNVKYPSDNASHVIKVDRAAQPEKGFKFNKSYNKVEPDKDFTTMSNTQACASARRKLSFDVGKDQDTKVVNVQPLALKVMHIVNNANDRFKHVRQGSEIVRPSTILAETCVQAEKTVTMSQNADTHNV